MNGVYFYFVNKLFLVGLYWDFNCLPEKKQMESIVIHKINIYQMVRYVFDRIENILGKKKILVTSDSPLPNMIPKVFLL